jgi:fatty-acyl-CoA synthase
MDRPSYDCGVSGYPLLGMTIGDLLNRIASEHPDTEAIVSVQQDIRLTYREFLRDVDRLARSRMAIGVARGDRVGIWSLNYVRK